MMDEIIIADLNWTRKSIWDFVLHYSFKKTKHQRIIIPLYFSCLGFLAVVGIVAFIITQIAAVILMTLCAAAILGIFALAFYIMLNGMVNKLHESNSGNNGLELHFSPQGIVINKEGEPIGIISWDNISDYSEGDNAFYITTTSSSLIIAEYNSIKQGGRENLAALLAANKNRGKS